MKIPILASKSEHIKPRINGGGIACTLCAGLNHGTMNQVSNYVLIGDEMDVKQIGNIVDDSEIGFKNPQRGRIYDTEGLSPALNNCTGGGHEPKVLVKEATKQGYSEIKLGGGDEYSVPRQRDKKGTCY